MCEFPSWIETDDGTVLFLTDKDIANLSHKAVNDCCGHSALREIFPNAAGRDREGWPCPPVIAQAIAKGQMTAMARAGGITEVKVNRKGQPLLLSAGGDLDLCGLTSLPATAKLSAGGNLYLSGLKSLPATAKLSAGGDLYLSGWWGQVKDAPRTK